MTAKQRTERTTRETRTKPTERIPVGGFRDKLTVRFKDSLHPDKFYSRWVLDATAQGPRIVQFLEAGYEFVPSAEVTVGQTHVCDTEGVGSIVRRPADKEGKYLYLMRLPMEYHLEDKEAKNQIVDQTEQRLDQPDGVDTVYGEVKLSRK